MRRSNRLFDLVGDGDRNASRINREEIVELATMIEQIERNIGQSLQYYANRSGLTLLDAQALAAIVELGDNARLSAIAESARMPLSTMTGVAARLEKAGLVERRRATDDGRAFVLILTPKGVLQVKELFGPFFEQVSKVIETAEPGTLEALVESFRAVNEMALQLRATVDAQAED